MPIQGAPESSPRSILDSVSFTLNVHHPIVDNHRKMDTRMESNCNRLGWWLYLGYMYEYHPLTNGMTLFLGDNTLYFENGRDNIIVNGTPAPTEKLQTIIGGRTILPLRFLAEYAGYTVTWDPAEEKVTLLWERK